MTETKQQLIKALEEDIYDYCVFGLYNEKYPELTFLEVAEVIIKTAENIKTKRKTKNKFEIDLKECIEEHLKSTEPYVSLPPYETVISALERYKELEDTDVVKALMRNAERFMYKWEFEKELDFYLEKIMKEKEEYRQYLSPFDIVKVLNKLALGYSWG